MASVGRSRYLLWVRDNPSFLVGLVVALGVVLPWVGRGWLLALDWVHGPVVQLGAHWGTSVEYQPSILFGAISACVGDVFGNATMAWLLIALSLLIAATAVGRVTPGGPVAKVVASTIYSVNPFLFDRIYAGQIATVLGYALLPLAARSIVQSERGRSWSRWSGAAWVAFIGAVDVHFLWICAVLVVAVLVRQHSGRSLRWAIGTFLWLIPLDAYLLVADALQKTTVAVGSNDLAAFRTSADPTLGLLGNVAGLYGFWRPGPILPKAYVAAWPGLLAAILLVSLAGLWKSMRHRDLSTLTPVLALAGLGGFFLAMGDQGPTGALFRLLYDHVPGFAVMREPQKFSSLIALFYAVAAGIGVEQLIPRTATIRRQVGTSAVAVVAVLAYTPTLFGGLAGQLALSRYPSDWTAAAKAMNDKSGSVLALPLHDYVAFPFTQNRVIANPAPTFFHRRVLIGAEIEAGPLQRDSLSPLDAYLDQLVVNGPDVHELGHLLAHLGVRYVVLFKTADYRSYGWLAHQQDLVRVYDGDDITVYENPLVLPDGGRVTVRMSVPSLSCYLRLAQRTDLVGAAVTLSPGAPCTPPSVPPPAPLADVHRQSALSYRVEGGPSGVAVVPEAADGTWQAPGHLPVAVVDGVQSFEVKSAAVTIGYRRWWAPVVGDAVSTITLAFLLIVISYLPRRARRRASGVDARPRVSAE